MATWEDLKSYVGAATSDDNFVQECWQEAQDLVDPLLVNLQVPESIKTRAYKECGEKLFNRRRAINRQAQYATFDGAPVLTAKDALVTVYPLLQPFSTGIA